jgi:hypothetical protein
MITEHTLIRGNKAELAEYFDKKFRPPAEMYAKETLKNGDKFWLNREAALAKLETASSNRGFSVIPYLEVGDVDEACKSYRLGLEFVLVADALESFVLNAETLHAAAA